jgi:hypothetical protein
VTNPMDSTLGAELSPDRRVKGENEFLRGQVATKDDQVRQANIVTRGLECLIGSLTGRSGQCPGAFIALLTVFSKIVAE